MASQAIVLRLHSADQVTQAITIHAGPIEKILNELIREDMEENELPVLWGTGLRALGRRLRRFFETAQSADQANEDEQLDDIDPRNRRDTNAHDAGEAISTLREGVRITRGTAAEAKLGVVGTTPRRPEDVLLTGQQVLPRIDDAASVPLLRAGFSFDPAPAKASLAAALPLLQAALLDVAREEKEAGVTLVNKHASLEAYDRVFAQVANLVSALLEAVGEYELARRVRPSLRRPGVTTAVEEELVPPGSA